MFSVGANFELKIFYVEKGYDRKTEKTFDRMFEEGGEAS